MDIRFKIYDRRSMLYISKGIDISREQIQEAFNDIFIRVRVDYSDENDYNTEYRISQRITQKQKISIEKRMYALAGMNYDEARKERRKVVKSKPKNKKINKNIIVGFKGNLIAGELKFIYG